ncbi:GNAT family N-acetyltransferase [Mycobacterium intracellulare]|nr:hypothetical protein [Mycobacterium intracellulare]
MRLRMATPEDAGAIVDIYLPYVRDTAVSFETVAPSVHSALEGNGSPQESSPP